MKLKLEFDWRDAPEADPMGMVVYFYPEEEYRSDISADYGNGTIRIDLSGKDGGEIDIPIGNYRVIAYNNDSELCFGINSHDYTGHHLRTRNASLTELVDGFYGKTFNVARPDGTEEESVVMQPDEMWGCRAIDVSVTEHGVSYKCYPLEEIDEWFGLPPTVSEHIITLYPHDLLCRYDYEIRHVVGLSSVTHACAAISGMSPAYHLGNMLQMEERSILPLNAYRADATTIKGEFLTFGHPKEFNNHKFALYVWSDKEEPYFFGKDEKNFDVTLQVDTAPDQKRVHLVIDSLDLSKGGVPVNPGSLNPGFDEWNEHQEDLIFH